MPITALFSLIGLLALWLMVATLWKAYRIASLRQDLFDIRGQLFDLVLASPDLPFSHPAYRHLRTTLNSLIRFAHRMSLIQYAATMSLSFPDVTAEVASQKWKMCLEGLPGGVREELGRIRLRMHVAVAGFIFRIPESLIIRYVGDRRHKVPYVGEGRLKSAYRDSSPYRYHIVATLRKLEHQAVQERKHELEKQKNVALV
jgi:hypothetical protein